MLARNSNTGVSCEYREIFKNTYFQQKQQQEMPFCKKSRSSEFCNIHCKTPMKESLFSEFADIQSYKLIKRRLQHRCFTVNIRRFLRIPVLKNICERLALFEEHLRTAPSGYDFVSQFPSPLINFPLTENFVTNL